MKLDVPVRTMSTGFVQPLAACGVVVASVDRQHNRLTFKHTPGAMINQAFLSPSTTILLKSGRLGTVADLAPSQGVALTGVYNSRLHAQIAVFMVEQL